MFVQGNIAPGITAPGLFDGFNIDWEFPTASDTQNFTALLAEFRSQLDALGKNTGKHYVMSFDGPAGAQSYVYIDLKHAAEQVDFITDRWLQLRRIVGYADESRLAAVR